MIAKYQGEFFNVSPLHKKPVKIWRYSPAEGFVAQLHEAGFMVYKKYLDVTELDEVFDVGFSALWNGSWCGVHYSAKTDEVGLYSNNPGFAKEFGMREIERFAYEIVVPADSVSQYKFIYKDAINKAEREEIITLEQLRKLWEQFKTDLMPPRN